MSQIYVKLRMRGKGNKYRKLIATESKIYKRVDELISTSAPYTTETLMDQGEWFYLNDFSQTEYFIDILEQKFDTVDFDALSFSEFSDIDYMFIQEDGNYYLQNVSKTKLIKRKTIFHIGEHFRYDEECPFLTINDLPDAIYVRESDMLYFRNLSSITSIFKNISLLYREATNVETENFLAESFIVLKNDFSCEHVKTANRKRIALAMDTLSKLKVADKKKVFTYIADYCPDLRVDIDKFEIGSEDDLKMLLFGIEQRFYTTPVGEEKRIANSVIALQS